jgi:dihydrofolate reductase
MSSPVPEQLSKTIETLYRSESGRVLATLVRMLGDLDLAEEAMHEAFAAALESWPQTGIPEKPRPWLILSGSSTLISAVLEHGLANEVVLFIYPVLLGKGKRIFADGTPARAFELANTQALPSGIVINAYKFEGPLRNLK